MRFATSALAWTLATALTASAVPAAPGEATSERYALDTFREKAGDVTVIVDAYPTSLHVDDGYVPVSVAVGRQAGRGDITLTTESFVLVDGSGRRYAAAGYGEILKNYDSLSMDAALLRLRPIQVGQQFAASQELPASFYPYVGAGTKIDRMHLAPYTWFHTLIYFPRPEGGLDEVMTLELSGGGLAAPVDVRFRVPDRS